MIQWCFVASGGPRLVVAVTLVVTVLALPLSAQGKWWKSERFEKLLGLTTMQSERLEEIHQTEAPQLRAAKIQLDRQEARFSSLLKRDLSTESEVVAAIDELEAARGELSKLRTLHLYRMRQVLTPGQRATLEADFQQNRRRAGSGERPSSRADRRGSQ